jgi:rRNA processing protein Krr1/Pno1
MRKSQRAQRIVGDTSRRWKKKMGRIIGRSGNDRPII